MKRTLRALFLFLLFAAPTAAQAQFTYTTNNGAITLSTYTGTGGAVVISNFVTSIGENAFLWNFRLTSVTIPGSVSIIGDWAFEFCSGLTNVTIGNGLTNIGIGAFSYTALTDPTIRASVSSIGVSAFGYCPLLTAITVDINNQAYSSLDGVLFDKNKTVLLEFLGAIGGKYTIPNSVTSIGAEAFEILQLADQRHDR